MALVAVLLLLAAVLLDGGWKPVAALAALLLLWPISGSLPARGQGRLRGLFAVLAVGGAIVLVAVLVWRGPQDWSWLHAVAFVLVLIALALAAHEWPAWLLRTTALAAAVGAAVIAAHAGQAELAARAAADARVAVTRLDAVLARTLTSATKPSENAKKAGRTLAGSLGRLCRDAGGNSARNGASTIETCVAAESRITPKNAAKLRRRLAEAHLDLARLRLTTASDAKADTALAAGEMSTAAQALARSGEPRVIGLPDAIAAGGRRLVEKSPLAGFSVPVAPSETGWVLLLIAAGYGYRLLEVINSGRDNGPVAVETVTWHVKEQTDQFTAVLHHAVTTNIPEPGTVPGAKDKTPVTDLLAVDRLQGTIVSAAVTFVRAVGIPPRGYVVRASLLARPGQVRDAAAVDDYEVHVRVHDARTHRSLWADVYAAETPTGALQRGGCAAASWILCRSRAVPPWLQFTTDAADALGDYQRSRSTAPHDATASLERAIARDSTSGIALVQLGYHYDLAGRPVEALCCYERAVTLFPEYRLARYRAAIGWSGLSEIAFTVDEHTWRRLTCLTSGNQVDGESKEKRCLQIASKRFTQVGDCGLVTWLGSLCLRMLSVHERTVLPPLSQVLWTHRTLRAAGLPTKVRNGQVDAALLKRLGKRAGSPAAPWQLRYNLACAYSVIYQRKNTAAHRDEAIRLLRNALLHPDGQQLNATWLARDPDLAGIRHLPDFTALLALAATDRSSR